MEANGGQPAAAATYQLRRSVAASPSRCTARQWRYSRTKCHRPQQQSRAARRRQAQKQSRHVATSVVRASGTSASVPRPCTASRLGQWWTGSRDSARAHVGHRHRRVDQIEVEPSYDSYSREGEASACVNGVDLDFCSVL
ncbi:hypothetical protein E2562_032516 [Oryza meyeriana var. granulata]|uniref:Uncharacterized protein n=1 Tax=Oryza meyeriana var. granulata TaxID=110450 RepID=A0A6G1DQE5_9ORYZ|nr:hypothetical protein E2562_032516 [Oryza meyeriana var. granulata]